MTPKIEYQGYSLDFVKFASDKEYIYYQVTCPKLSISFFCKNTDVDSLTTNFHERVDSHLKSLEKIYYTYQAFLRCLSYNASTYSTTRLKQDLKDIYELFGDLLDLSETDIRREYFESTSKKE